MGSIRVGFERYAEPERFDWNDCLVDESRRHNSRPCDNRIS